MGNPLLSIKEEHVPIIAKLQNIIVHEVDHESQGFSVCLIYEMCRFDSKEPKHYKYMSTRNEIFINQICGFRDIKKHAESLNRLVNDLRRVGDSAEIVALTDLYSSRMKGFSSNVQRLKEVVE